MVGIGVANCGDGRSALVLSSGLRCRLRAQCVARALENPAVETQEGASQSGWMIVEDW